jgi:hypothetical protein
MTAVVATRKNGSNSRRIMGNASTRMIKKREAGGSYIMRNSAFAQFTISYQDDQFEEDKIGTQRSKHGTEMICIGYFGREHEGEKQLARLRRRWDTIKMGVKETGHEDVN